ncbi:zinc transport system substrate-binding protein [Modicisalibacter muralis]|uniref:Zinc transport system substrate-binding protein n=1 Tax=Modicisalibacter muralis TaxID=119000 RepID=A0A1G9I2B2_9GAMM|nr:metal-binding protein ZinT [Halomonas muralis]SDL19387.1 zinc transport system substrate-binding protein [Halomonas muralis]
MQMMSRKSLGMLAFGSLALLAAQAQGSGNVEGAGSSTVKVTEPTESQHSHSEHSHDHGHSHDHDDIHNGYFEDSQVKARPLSNWAGDWQSVYPYLKDGTLDPVMAHKAEHGDKSAQEYREYYEAGYRTDVDRIVIEGATVTFHDGNEQVEGQYTADGYEILTYAAGNRGVRYIFELTRGDDDAPQFIQFSDHGISPARADHYHLYWGDDREALLQEVTNWPTYYPSALNGEQIAHEMVVH